MKYNTKKKRILSWKHEQRERPIPPLARLTFMFGTTTIRAKSEITRKSVYGPTKTERIPSVEDERGKQTNGYLKFSFVTRDGVYGVTRVCSVAQKSSSAVVSTSDRNAQTTVTCFKRINRMENAPSSGRTKIGFLKAARRTV